MEILHTFDVLEQDKTARLDVFLSEKLGISRSQTKKLVVQNQVLVNDKKPKKAGDRLHEGDNIKVVSIDLSLIESTKTAKIKDLKNYKIEIVEETEDYIIVNKPSGLLVHPTEAYEADTLTAWLLERYPEISKVGDNKEQRPGIVHRLDKEASGLLVVARTQKSFKHLKKQFKDRTVEKFYSVLVYGHLEKKHGKIDFEIDRGKDGRMVSRPKTDKLRLKNVLQIQDGKESLTEYWVEQEFVRFSLLKVKIHTGRTHQIRVHMLASGVPVVGDPLYKNRKLVKKSDVELDRLFLCARELAFIDLQGEKKHFKIDLPEELKIYLQNFK